MDRKDTKATRELIRALNPESELRAVDKQEEEFIERAQLRRDTKRNSVFRKGIKYLKKRMTRKKNQPISPTNTSYNPIIRSKKSKVSNILSQ